MVKRKTKPLLPSLRERKRYLAYEIISEQRFYDAVEISKAISDAAKEFLGALLTAKAGILTLDDQFNSNLQKGILRVNHKRLDDLKSSLIFIKKIKESDVIVRSIGASGILKKTKEKYLN